MTAVQHCVEYAIQGEPGGGNVVGKMSVSSILHNVCNCFDVFPNRGAEHPLLNGNYGCVCLHRWDEVAIILWTFNGFF